jgi:UDP-N-acetylmuramoylalanine--D-glutamate ligase
MNLTFAAQQRFAIFGLGKSGLSTARALIEGGAFVVAWDDKAEHVEAFQKEMPRCRAASPEIWEWEGIKGLVLSPGIPLYGPKQHPVVTLAKSHRVPVFGDIELLYQALPESKYIAITGTNGKSTTTSLIGHILTSVGSDVEVGGNLGRPVLDFKPAKTFVIEASSYQLDLIRSTRFNIALLLNFSPDHLDRHGTMEDYIAAKRHIFDRQHPEDIAIIGVDEPISEAICREMIAKGTQRVIPISGSKPVQRGVYVENGILHHCLGGKEVTASLKSIKSLQGDHNAQNAAAAYAAAFTHGLSHDEIMAAMQTFPGLVHRMQWLGTRHGVQYVNDSKATNANAAEKALMTYDNIYWILGGIPKEGGIASLAKYFPKIRHAYVIGEAISSFPQVLGTAIPHAGYASLAKAFEEARADAEREKQPEAVVLLSPACASFDQFRNFEERGEAFVQMFKKI